jgi:hypothetical protein
MEGYSVGGQIPHASAEKLMIKLAMKRNRYRSLHTMRNKKRNMKIK